MRQSLIVVGAPVRGPGKESFARPLRRFCRLAATRSNGVFPVPAAGSTAGVLVGVENPRFAIAPSFLDLSTHWSRGPSIDKRFFSTPRGLRAFPSAGLRFCLIFAVCRNIGNAKLRVFAPNAVWFAVGKCGLPHACLWSVGRSLFDFAADVKLCQGVQGADGQRLPSRPR